MRSHASITIFSFFIAIMTCSVAAELKPLKKEQAAAIVAATEADRSAKEAERLRVVNDVRILSEGSYIDESGNTVIIRQIEAPEGYTDQQSNDPSSGVYEPQSKPEAFWADAKKTHSFMLSATIYEGKYTYLSWQHNGREYCVWTRVDWDDLREVVTLETDTASYLIFMGIGEMSFDSPYAKNVPDLSDLRDTDYLLVEGDLKDSAAFEVIDALLSYYEKNEKSLKVRTQRRRALEQARREYRDAHPEKPKGTSEKGRSWADR